MKKLLLIIAAIFTLSSVHADLILHESFDREVGQLSKGANTTMGENTTDWWSFSGSSNYIQVISGSLTSENYVASTGNKVKLTSGNAADDLRQFTPITTGKVYVGAIINIDSLRQYASTAAATITKNGDYFLAMGDAGTAMYARLYARSVKEDGADSYTKVQLGIAKNNEQSTSSTDVIPMVDVDMKKDIFVVLEYEFIDGAKNDVARLYVNPTKETTAATLTCALDVSTSGGSAVGANSRNDASKIASVNLRQGTNTPGRVYVDEIRVATTWAELFGEGGNTPIEDNPELTVSTKTLSFASGMPFTGETYTATFTVTGKNLKGDITLTSDNTELTLDKTTITKADAETEAGVVVTATLTPVLVDGQKANITLTTEGATATITSSWWTTDVKACATVAELKAQAATASGWDYAYMRFTGEAVVTYKYAENNGATTLYLEDNTAAISVSDTYWNDAVKQGDKVTNFAAYTYADAAVGGVLPITPLNATITVLSSNNEVVPQVVTLAELQSNPLDYLLELVKVENVTLDQTSTKFGQKTQDEQESVIPDKISQNGATATISLVEGNELINAVKPKTADIIGISLNTLGNAIRVRGAADVISKDGPTAIDNIALDVLNGDYEVYTVSGQRIDALQPGINIIRQGDKTYKVVR